MEACSGSIVAVESTCRCCGGGCEVPVVVSQALVDGTSAHVIKSTATRSAGIFMDKVNSEINRGGCTNERVEGRKGSASIVDVLMADFVGGEKKSKRVCCQSK